jgi:hypothetical protein
VASDEITIDLTGFKDRIGQRVAPGRYKVVVDDTENDTAKSGNPMINLWFRVVEGEFKDAVVIDRLVQTPASMFRTVGFLQAIGLPAPRTSFRVRPSTWINKVLEIDVEDGEPYNGRVKSEVRGYNRISGVSTSKPADLGDLDGLGEFAPQANGKAAADDEIATAAVPDEVDLDKLDLG